MGTNSIFDEKHLNVVVDTDRLTLRVLELKTKSRTIYNGGKIKCYNDPGEFLRDLKSFPEATNFYFGAYFGFGCKIEGGDLAKAVKDLDKSLPVFVVTSVPDAPNVVGGQKNGFIDAVFPKEIYFTEPHDNGQLSNEENEEFFSALKIIALDTDSKKTYLFYHNDRHNCLQEILRIRAAAEAVGTI